jgi:hypothetical protein
MWSSSLTTDCKHNTAYRGFLSQILTFKVSIHLHKDMFSCCCRSLHQNSRLPSLNKSGIHYITEKFDEGDDIHQPTLWRSSFVRFIMFSVSMFYSFPVGDQFIIFCGKITLFYNRGSFALLFPTWKVIYFYIKNYYFSSVCILAVKDIFWILMIYFKDVAY